MIIVEGPDGAGKTTLIEQLALMTSLEVAPRVVSKDTKAMVDLVKWTEENINAGFQATIFDRHRLISEPIYGPAMRKDPEPGFSDAQWFYEQLRGLYELKPIIIYCLPPFEVVWANVLKGEDNWVFHDNPSLMRQIWGAYYNKAISDQVLYRSSWLYDYTEGQWSKHLIGAIARAINKRIEK